LKDDARGPWIKPPSGRMLALSDLLAAMARQPPHEPAFKRFVPTFTPTPDNKRSPSMTGNEFLGKWISSTLHTSPYGTVGRKIPQEWVDRREYYPPKGVKIEGKLVKGA